MLACNAWRSALPMKLVMVITHPAKHGSDGGAGLGCQRRLLLGSRTRPSFRQLSSQAGVTAMGPLDGDGDEEDDADEDEDDEDEAEETLG